MQQSSLVQQRPSTKRGAPQKKKTVTNGKDCASTEASISTNEALAPSANKTLTKSAPAKSKTPVTKTPAASAPATPPKSKTSATSAPTTSKALAKSGQTSRADRMLTRRGQPPARRRASDARQASTEQALTTASNSDLARKLFEDSREAIMQTYLSIDRDNLATNVLRQQLTMAANKIIHDYNLSAAQNGQEKLSEDARNSFISQVNSVMSSSALTALIDRADVETIHVLGHQNVIVSLAGGRRVHAPPIARSEEELVMMISHLAATSGGTSQQFNRNAPILDVRLASGHHLFAITSISEQTSAVIHRQSMISTSLEVLERSGTITPSIRAVLRAAVNSPKPVNMLIIGSKGAGKTTLLRSLLAEVPQSEFLITVEDAFELCLQASGVHRHTLALGTRSSDLVESEEISAYDLTKTALKMSPDRIIVGEIRGGEAAHLLHSMSVGNDGSVSTIQAHNVNSAINKMLLYTQRTPDSPNTESILREISESLHLVIHIEKLPNGRRVVQYIHEVTGFDGEQVCTSEVFSPDRSGVGTYMKQFEPNGTTLARLRASGFDPQTLGKAQFTLSRKKENLRRIKKPSQTPQPQLQTPQLQAPQPQFQLEQKHHDATKTPQIDTPQQRIGSQQINQPQIGQPQIEFPQIELPQIDLQLPKPGRYASQPDDLTPTAFTSQLAQAKTTTSPVAQTQNRHASQNAKSSAKQRKTQNSRQARKFRGKQLQRSQASRPSRRSARPYSRISRRNTQTIKKITTSHSQTARNQTQTDREPSQPVYGGEGHPSGGLHPDDTQSTNRISAPWDMDSPHSQSSASQHPASQSSAADKRRINNRSSDAPTSKTPPSQQQADSSKTPQQSSSSSSYTKAPWDNVL